MGRYYYDKKEEADYLYKIEIWWLKKHGYLSGWRSGNITWSRGGESKSSISITGDTLNEADPHIRFYYTHTSNQTGQKTELDYKIKVVTTACNYGGKRYWFICPLSKGDKACGRRVAVLYLGGKYFGCRHCYNLSYSSKNENRRNRLMPMFGYLMLDSKLEKLEKQIKRPYYRGKPTKKQRKFQRMKQQQWGYYLEGSRNNWYNDDVHPP